MNATDASYKNRRSNLDAYSEKFLLEEIKRFGLDEHKPFGIECDTLLDVACGNGVFSNKFSKFFKVTGEDLSPEGIKRANIENKNKNIEYKTCDCINETSKHDIVFVRGPSFFIKNNIYSETFSKYLSHLMGRCNKIFAFGQFNKDPNAKAYKYHKKEDLNNVFSKYGKILKHEMHKGYLFLIVKKN